VPTSAASARTISQIADKTTAGVPSPLKDQDNRPLPKENFAMDLYNPNSDGATFAPFAASIDGRQLSRRLKNLSPAKRALLALDLERGGLHHSTRPQSAKLAQVSRSYIATVSRASDEERKRLANGCTSLSSIHNQYRRRPVTDADVERIVKKIGVSRVFAALDKLTAPQHLEAAE
jgi:hypothetical protein